MPIPIPLTPYGVKSLQLRDPTGNAAPPGPGGTIESFFDVFFKIELDSIGHNQPYQGTGHGRMRLHYNHDNGGDTRYFDTEMVSMDLSGGTLPPYTLVRESPKQPSVGTTTIQSLPGGQFKIDSFFDVFVELSVDGGQSWQPASAPMTETLGPDQPTAARPGSWGAIKRLYR
ncbi:MAG TPA: hypothetical protein VGK89_06050 [Candidatus Eisenbacteria bacterium]